MRAEHVLSAGDKCENDEKGGGHERCVISERIIYIYMYDRAIVVTRRLNDGLDRIQSGSKLGIFRM